MRLTEYHGQALRGRGTHQRLVVVASRVRAVPLAQQPQLLVVHAGLRVWVLSLGGWKTSQSRRTEDPL